MGVCYLVGMNANLTEPKVRTETRNGNVLTYVIDFPATWVAPKGQPAQDNKRANWLYTHYTRFFFIGVNEDWSVTVRTYNSFN